MRRFFAIAMLAGGALHAEAPITGDVARARSPIPQTKGDWIIDCFKMNIMTGRLYDNPMVAMDMLTGAEYYFQDWLSLYGAVPLYFDKADNAALASGDMFLGLHWTTEWKFSSYVGAFPFITIPTGIGSYTEDTVRGYSTRGLDYGFLLTWAYWDSWGKLIANLGLYDPHQGFVFTGDYGAHTNQVLYRFYADKPMSKNIRLGTEVSVDWFYISTTLTEVAHYGGGTPIRMNILSFFSPTDNDNLQIGLSAGGYLTKRSIERNGEIVYARVPFTTPRGDIYFEIGMSFTYNLGQKELGPFAK